MAKIKITQVKSSIGSSVHQKKVLESLGLKKLNKPVEHNDTPEIRGMIAKISHMVNIAQ